MFDAPRDTAAFAGRVRWPFLLLLLWSVAVFLPGQFDFIFHDAVHGPTAFFEYLGCAEIASGLAIHDYELLPAEMQAAVAAKFSHTTTDADSKGRVLFMGWK
jgi:hypothetical protein